MTLVHNVSDKAKRYIQNKLEELAQTHNIKILLAIESGSRAWGFPSKDSDYDVRFIYSRPINDYLSIELPKDVIVTEITDDPFLGVPYDASGWDIRKTLQLALKSNSVLIEWLRSPVVYMANEA